MLCDPYLEFGTVQVRLGAGAVEVPAYDARIGLPVLRHCVEQPIEQTVPGDFQKSDTCWTGRAVRPGGERRRRHYNRGVLSTL